MTYGGFACHLLDDVTATAPLLVADHVGLDIPDTSRLPSSLQAT